MKRTFFVLVMITALGLTACASPTGVSPTQPSLPDLVGTIVAATMQALPTRTPGSTCPELTAGTLLLRNEEHGYCFLYPDGYVRLDPLPYEVCLVPEGPSMACHGANLMIEVQDTADRTVGQLADEMIAEHPLPEIVERLSLTVDGEDSVVLDGLPGVAAARNVFIIHARQLYHLTFIPWDESGDEFEGMQAFYTTVISSFTFIP